MTMTFKDFHHALRIMTNLDRDELVAAGVMAADENEQWGRFQVDPYRWFIRAGDERAQKLFALIEGRLA